MEDIVITGYARTPFGAFMGSLASVPAPKLGATAIKAALERSALKPSDVSEVLMGNVLPAGIGQAPARQACRFAEVLDSVPCVTVNKVCGSGMMTLIFGSQSLQLGESEVVVAGGMENMSQAPYLSKEARAGMRLGNQTLIDSMVNDGLWDPYNNQHMGNCAELCASEHKLTREDQDAFAIESYQRAQKAAKDGHLQKEIASVEIPGRKGKVTIVDQDEGPDMVNFDRLPSLRPVFDKNGSITAANASTINDGAACCVLMREDTAKQRGIAPLARIVAHSRYAHAPEWFTTAPVHAIEKAVSKAGWKMEEVDLFEVNEAFAVVSMYAQNELKIPAEKLNIWGGAIAIGHPIGASGTRIIGTLISALRENGLKRGVAGICIGGGEALAVCVEVIA